MLVTKPGDDITFVHTTELKSAEQRHQFHGYANGPEGLPMARERSGNRYVSPYDSLADDRTVLMLSCRENVEAWDACTATTSCTNTKSLRESHGT